MAEVTGLRNNALPYPVYGVPYGIVFPLLDADGDPISPSSQDSEVSLNGDTFADCTNEAVEIASSSGSCYLLLTAAEMTADVVTVQIKSTGAKTTVLTLYPRKLVQLRAGTVGANAGDGTTIQLDSGASAVDDFYNGCLIVGTLDSNVEARMISDYNGSTKVCTITPAFVTTPDNNDTFVVYQPEGRQVSQADLIAWLSTALATPDTAGYPKVTIKDGTGTGEIDTTSGGVLVAAIANNAITANAINADAITNAKIADDAIAVENIKDGAITAAKIASDAIDADAIKADAVTEIQNGLATASALSTLDGKVDTVDANVDSILADTDEVQQELADGGRLDLLIDAIKAITDVLISPATIATAVWAAGTRTLSAFGFNVSLADDAITAGKFDESTAFPLKSADSGSTAVARTGADSDTLETLSDQIDGVSSGGGAAGAGAIEYVATINVSGNPLEGASVWVSTDEAGTNVVAGTLVTDSMGHVTFMLDEGTFYLWMQKDGYQPILGEEFEVTA